MAFDQSLGMGDHEDIADDGGDGLDHGRGNHRNSMRSVPASERGARPAIGAAAAIGGAAAGGVAANRFQRDYEAPRREKADHVDKQRRSKRWKLAVIILVTLIITGGVVGAIVGTVVTGAQNRASDNGGFNDDSKGDLGVQSSEIQKLLNNQNLHKVSPGMDYTPMNTQHPDCLNNPPSQNNVTRDIAVLSQLTNKIRLYGTDCNQTEMVLHAVKQLKLEKVVKIWMGIWQDDNLKTNQRQLSQMWDILDKYGADPFEGLIVANEILFRKQMTISTLGSLLTSVRTNLTSRSMKLPVATSDLGNDWTAALAAESDYVMSNIHPFFTGKPVEEAATFTLEFWNTHNAILLKDKSKGIIAETGWPTAGGTNCGLEATICTKGAVAGVDGLNRFMNDWVCQSLENNITYFWFSAFDEPWKIRFNEPGKEWEDKWGLMDVNRNIKSGVKIPSCGGKTV